MSKVTFTPTESEREWFRREQEHRLLYAFGGHGPWFYCGCPLSKWLKANAGLGGPQ